MNEIVCHPEDEQSLVHVEVVDGDDGVVARVRGELDMTANGIFDDAVARAQRRGCGLLVDLRETSFIDVSGLSKIAAARRALGQGGDVRVLIGQPMQRKLLRLTRMDEILRIEDHVDGHRDVAT